MKVVLKEDAMMLSDVVVVGFGKCGKTLRKQATR